MPTRRIPLWLKFILAAGAAVVLFEWGCNLTHMDEFAYLPPAIPDGRIAVRRHGLQGFLVTDHRLKAIVSVLPQRDGDTEYVVDVLIIAAAGETADLSSARLSLSLIDGKGPQIDSVERRFDPNRRAPLVSTDKGPGYPHGSTHNWMQSYRIEPDLDPYTDKRLILRLSFDYTDADGTPQTFEAKVPLVPHEITIPTSVV